MKWPFDFFSSRKPDVVLESAVAEKQKEVDHWRKHSDTLAASRHAHAKTVNEQAKVIQDLLAKNVMTEYFEDYILSMWGEVPLDPKKWGWPPK